MKVKIEFEETNHTKKNIILGHAFYADTMFAYRIYDAPPSKCPGDPKKVLPGEYKYIIEEHIISPQSGKILQSSQKAKKLRKKLSKMEKDLLSAEESHSMSVEEIDRAKNKIAKKREKMGKKQSLEDLNATGYKYLQDLKNVKKAIEELTLKLYADYQDDILRELGLSCDDKNHLHTRTAYELYQNDFFASKPATTKKVLDGKKSDLKKICTLLNDKSISEIIDADIRAAMQHAGKKPRKKLDLLEEFLGYCGEQGILTGVNPVTHFKQTNSWIDDAKNNGKNDESPYPKASTHLREKCEKNLYELIESSIEDDMSLAIPLVCGAGLSVKEIIDINWEMIEISGNQVRIHVYKQNFVGGTHNYIRPPTRGAADLICKKYNYLATKIGRSNGLKKMKVVPIPGKEIKEKKAIITKYFREKLSEAGVTANEFESAIDKEHPKAEGGAGYNLLKKHYEYILQERCGVDLDSPVGCYLRGVRIYDTTGDYYRALSDDTGNCFLQTVMDRDDVFLDSTGPVTLSCYKSGGMWMISTTKGPPGTRTRLITSRKITIPKGSEVIFRGKNHGITGEASFTRMGNLGNNDANYIKLY